MENHYYGSVKKQIVASDLIKERAKCAFDKEELRTYLLGGYEIEKHKQYYRDLWLKYKDDLKNTPEFQEMTIPERQEDLWRRVRFLHQNAEDYMEHLSITKWPYHGWMHNLQGLVPVGMHYSMFAFVVHAQANKEQRNYWCPLIAKHKILGCYAQTELGHGSDVMGLETTATLDRETDQWIINSPTKTSTKFWPGDLGNFCSHAAVFAKLIIDGNVYGLHCFLVPLRDLNTWRHLKGVKTGDLGPKYGYSSKDNGWATFDNVRVPRTNMLMGLAEVDKAGNFSLLRDIRVLYSTMLFIRTYICMSVGNFLSGALQIAIRYACVRRQFPTIEGSKQERSLIDYQTMQHILTPLLAAAIVQNVTGNFMREEFRRVMDQIEEDNFEGLDVLHHLLAGFKDRQSDESIQGVEKCRRACGGTGFQSGSGFTELSDVGSPFPTFEGDNTVMVLQASRYIFKLLAWANKGKDLPYPFQYINKLKELSNMKGKGTTVEELFDIDVLFNGLAARAALLIKEVSQSIQESNEPHKVKENELFAQPRMNMVRAHMTYLNYYVYRSQVENFKFVDMRIKPILLDLVMICALRSLLDDCGPVFDSGYFAPQAWKNMNAALDVLIKKIRPQMLSLGEIKMYPEHLLITNIGNYYGDVYEQQLEQAMNSRLNREDVDGVPSQWESYIKQFLHEEIQPKQKL